VPPPSSASRTNARTGGDVGGVMVKRTMQRRLGVDKTLLTWTEGQWSAQSANSGPS